jgi:hypothetical protein
MLKKNRGLFSSGHEVFKLYEMWKRKTEEIGDKILEDIKETEKDDMETINRVQNSFEKSSDEMELLVENLE